LRCSAGRDVLLGSRWDILHPVLKLAVIGPPLLSLFKKVAALSGARARAAAIHGLDNFLNTIAHAGTAAAICAAPASSGLRCSGRRDVLLGSRWDILHPVLKLTVIGGRGVRKEVTGLA